MIIIIIIIIIIIVKSRQLPFLGHQKLDQKSKKKYNNLILE